MPIQTLLGSCLESQSLSGLYAVTELTARIISHARITLLRQFPPHIACTVVLWESIEEYEDTKP